MFRIFTASVRKGESGSVADDGAGEFAKLYEPLRRFASVVRSPDMDADDLVQEALVRTLALQPLAELDDPAAYLRTVIVRLASNQRRTAGRRLPNTRSSGTRQSRRDRAATDLSKS